MSEKRLLAEAEPVLATSYGSTRSDGSIPNYWLNPPPGPQPQAATYRDTPTTGPQGYPPSTRSLREQQAVTKQPTPPTPLPHEAEGQVPPVKYPPDYLILSILTTVCAFFGTGMLFWCCTIPACICAINARSAREVGNYERARSCSRKAFCCNAACFISGVVLYLLGIISGAITYIVISTLQAKNDSN